MTTWQAGDLVLIDFPFTTSGQSKPRPALVLLDTGDADLVVARVTTQRAVSVNDVPLHDWQAAGLLAPSSVRLHKLATLAKSRIQKQLGQVQATDRSAVAAVLLRLFGKW